jgi:geranylgeranyl diphosphate synthase type II
MRTKKRPNPAGAGAKPRNANFSSQRLNFALDRYLRERQAMVEAALEKFFPAHQHFAQPLYDAMRHSLFAGGKRLRPILVLAAAEACGGSLNRVIPAACALECIHTYSLIHDDLPALDNDDLRRGRATCHKVFGEATAILAGDALLTYAFELLAPAERKGTVRAIAGLEAVRWLARAAGPAGMVGGQMADIQAENKPVDLPVLQYIHTHKTGRLIQAAVVIGGLLSGAGPSRIRALAIYGETLGLAFQIRDDILNVVGDAQRLGKQTGTDSAKGKATYPAVFGIEQSWREARELVERGLRSLSVLDKRADALRALAQYVVEREV